MRNRWGVEVKKGHCVRYSMPRGGNGEGVVAKIDRTSDMAKAYGARVILEDGFSVGIDDVSLSMGEMFIDAENVVRQNPLTRVRIKSPPQRPRGSTAKPSKRLTKRRKATEAAPPGYYANPLQRTTMRKESQREHWDEKTGNYTKKPSKRLVRRRAKTDIAPAGVWANPLTPAQEAKFKTVYAVHSPSQPPHLAIAFFTRKADAVEAAQEAATRTGKQLAVSEVSQYVG